MNFLYTLNKNLKEAASYKLVRRSETLLVFSNGSELGWLFFAGGVVITAMLLYSGFLAESAFQEELVASIFFVGTSVFFTGFGFLAGIGTSKLIIDLPSKTFSKQDLSLKGFKTMSWPLSGLSGLCVKITVLWMRGQYPVYIARLLSKEFKKDLVIGASNSRSKIDRVAEILRSQLGIPVIEGGKEE
jgi:hypothetical protein